MAISLAHLGPVGTYSESAASAYGEWLETNQQQKFILCPQPSIALALSAVAQKKVNYAVVPVENSIEGTVNITLDTLWQKKDLKILRGLTIPIVHSLLSYNEDLANIKTVYSHPQALGQCQEWLANNLPQVQLIAANSTTEALKLLKEDPTACAISSARAAEIYHVPILYSGINDRPDNCTRFLVIGFETNKFGSHISLAFGLEKSNVPGVLVKPLQIFAEREINLCKIESRPTKRSLGEYIFFIELEGSLQEPKIQEALAELKQYTEVLSIFGNYDSISVE
ncbi:Prephenate dehydratase [Hyella patelloides LEGE 07179]|uniref:Prephenate dehydratase n=1 Tax=Hyella patelloides LEGE 07179 TaxID=945734 RepID=A0A563VX59_9CYAN|nr:prephenate dehydratase [Hyella patelloides]VEP16001.1 Prephenate dehydratase [Hyella patelloides LEGE 07179]